MGPLSVAKFMDGKGAPVSRSADDRLGGRVIRSFDVFQSYREPWDQMAVTCGPANPFMSFDWLTACAQYDRVRMEPYVIVIGSAGTAKAFGPFGRVGRCIGRRRVAFLGGTHSDYQVVLHSPGAVGATQQVWRTLLEQRDWDWLDLYPIREEDAQHVMNLAQGRQDLSFSYRRKGTCPVLDLSQGFEERVGRAMVKDARYQWRRLQQLGQIEVRRAATEAELRGLLAGLADLHRRRWAATAQTSRFAEEDRQEEFEALARIWLGHGVLDATGLYVGNRLIAAHIGARTPQRCYWHTPSFDPEFSRYSPGKVLLWWLLEDCRSQGVRHFDFLRGDEDYKNAWGGVPESTYGRLTVYRAWMVNARIPWLTDRLAYFSSRARWRLSKVAVWFQKGLRTRDRRLV